MNRAEVGRAPLQGSRLKPVNVLIWADSSAQGFYACDTQLDNVETRLLTLDMLVNIWLPSRLTRRDPTLS